MKLPTRRQLEVLCVLNPFNGHTTYKGAAIKLNTTENNIKKIMSRFKARCPRVYWNFKALRKKLNNGQRDVDSAIIIDPDKLIHLVIKEKF